MKPFDLEAAKRGEAICTRDGRPARIIEFNMKNKNFPIVAIISCKDEEKVASFTKEGNYYTGMSGDVKDLMMAPEIEEGWINVYKTETEFVGGKIFSSKEEALDKRYAFMPYVDTVKIKVKPK